MKQETEMIEKEEKETLEFSVGEIAPVAITLVVAGTVIVLGLQLQEDTAADLTAGSAAANASTAAIEGTGKLGTKLPLIAGVVVMVIVIGLLMRYFGK